MTFIPAVTVAEAIVNVDALDGPGASGLSAKHRGDQWNAKRVEARKAQTPGRIEWFETPAKGSRDEILAVVVSAGGGLVRVRLDRKDAAALLCQLARVLAS